jgi:hypothetical protein
MKYLWRESIAYKAFSNSSRKPGVRRGNGKWREVGEERREGDVLKHGWL